MAKGLTGHKWGLYAKKITYLPLPLSTFNQLIFNKLLTVNSFSWSAERSTCFDERDVGSNIYHYVLTETGMGANRPKPTLSNR